MGRTNPTYRNALSTIKASWSAYRRALRRRVQPRFDELFEYARKHADAAGNLNPHEPMHPVFFSIDLEQQRRIAALEERVADLEAEREDDSESG